MVEIPVRRTKLKTKTFIMKYFLSVICPILLFTHPVDSFAQPVLKAGASQVNITPPLGTVNNPRILTTLLYAWLMPMWGYVPPPAQLETWRCRSSYMEPQAEPKLRECLYDLVRKCNKK